MPSALEPLEWEAGRRVPHCQLVEMGTGLCKLIISKVTMENVFVKAERMLSGTRRWCTLRTRE